MDEDTPEVSGLMQRWGFKEDFLLTLLFLILQARKYTFDYNSANLDCCSISEDPCKDSWSQQPQLLLAKSLEQDQIKKKKKKIHSSEQQTSTRRRTPEHKPLLPSHIVLSYAERALR